MERWHDSQLAPKALPADEFQTAMSDRISEEVVMGGMTNNGIAKPASKKQRNRETRASRRAKALANVSTTALTDGVAPDIEIVNYDISRSEKRKLRREKKRTLRKQKEKEERANDLAAYEPPAAVAEETSQAMVVDSATGSGITKPMTKNQRRNARKKEAALARDSSQKGVKGFMVANGITKKTRQSTLNKRTRRGRARAEKPLPAGSVVPDKSQDTSNGLRRSIAAKNKTHRYNLRPRTKWDTDKLLAEIEKLSLDPSASISE